ncbi:MAG TPA: alginate export family protein [Bacteroidales bacterium]|jgi:hypothetical protein|nr:alginate export family protein [Bacteroidales bacterium]
MNRFLLVIAVLGFNIKVFSQFVVTGEFRPKFEFRDGYKTLLSEDQRPLFITAQRSRLNLNYTDGRIATRLSVQDVRIWGESPSKTDASSINVFEAWVEYFVNNAWSFRLGRQELSFDQNRLLGASNWNDVGASHDLLLIRYNKNFNLQTGFAYNNDKSKNYESNYPVSFYKTLAFIRAEKDMGKYLNASLIFIADGNQKEESNDTIYQRLTYGGNLLFSNDSIRTKVYGTFYYQSGKSPEGIPINAWFLAGNLDYRISKNTNAIVGVDYFSGDNAFSASGIKHSFNNLYGNTHNYYGYMDYFGQIDKDTKGGGMMDLYLRLNYKFNKKATAELTYHYFSFTNDAIDSVSNPEITEKADRSLGSEIDLMIKYKPVSNVEISLGYSAMLATRSMGIIKSGSHEKYQQWAWLMLTFKPEFINTNNKN